MRTGRFVARLVPFAVTFLIASTASAAGPFGISVSGGTAPFIAGNAGSGAGAPEYGDAFEQGWLVRVEPYCDLTPVWRLQLGLLFEQRGGKNFSGVNFSDLKRGAIYVGGKARLMPASPLSPYFVADIGVGKINREDISIGGFSARYWDETNTVFFDLGGGLEYKVGSNLGLFLDVRAEVFGAPNSVLPPASDSDASWAVPISVGINYSF